MEQVIKTPRDANSGSTDTTSGSTGNYNLQGGLTEISTNGGGAGLATGSLSTNSLVSTAIGWVMFIVGALSVGLVIWGGFKYMTSSGDSGKVKSAKNIILYGLIGLAIVILSYVIVKFVLSSVGVTVQ